MNRGQWQSLAEERVNDANALLAAQRWSAAYYLTGYAVECGLKSCVLAYVGGNPDVIFVAKRFSEKCWTHDLANLVDLADLEPIRLTNAAANLALGANWSLALQWSEQVRYQQKSESDAQRLYEAVTHNANGVLPWIRIHW